MNYFLIPPIVGALLLGSVSIADKVIESNKLQLPKANLFEEKTPLPAFRVTEENGIPAIYLSSTIEDPDKYLELLMFINNNKNIPSMKLYLSGNGGSVKGAMDLAATMQASKTKFDVIVYGHVYSAHAFLAFAGTTLTITDPSIDFLFHVPALQIGNENVKIKDSCPLDVGKDRGVDKVHKCNVFADKYLKAFDEMIVARIRPYLTAEQYKEFVAGDDVILSAADLYKQGLKH